MQAMLSEGFPFYADWYHYKVSQHNFKSVNLYLYKKKSRILSNLKMLIYKKNYMHIINNVKMLTYKTNYFYVHKYNKKYQSAGMSHQGPCCPE